MLVLELIVRVRLIMAEYHGMLVWNSYDITGSNRVTAVAV